MVHQISIKLRQLARHNKEGQDLIEYALMAAFIAVAIAATFPTTIGPNICTIFIKVGSTLTQSSQAS
jgi:Flp pilus assembly pilin Flp